MKIIALFFVLLATPAMAQTYGYTYDGTTVVQPYASAPDGSYNNNYAPNVGPYNGQALSLVYREPFVIGPSCTPSRPHPYVGY